MTTYTLIGYGVTRDPGTPRIGKFDLRQAVDYDRSEIRFVSANDARSFLQLAAIGELTDVNLGDMIDIRIDDQSIFEAAGTLSSEYEVYVADVTYSDGGTRSLIEFGIFETDGDQSWHFQLGGDLPSYGLGSLRFVQRFDEDLISVDAPGAPFAPGTNIFLDTIVDVRVTEDDFYQAGDGDDVISLGLGRDTLRGGDGDDSLIGADGADSLYGEDGDDTLDGGGSRDRLIGGDGDDRLIGGLDNDTLEGGFGQDVLQGDSGSDVLSGADGSDTLIGGAMDDFLSGGQGVVTAGDLQIPLANFGPNQGWASQNTTPRLLADIDGDGAADIVGFGGPRTFSALNDGGGGFGGLIAAVDNFALAQGWKSQETQLRLLGDIDGDGDDDIVGFGFRNGFASESQGDGTFAGFALAVANFANAQGWTSQDRTPRLMADVNGDGVDDIVGFGFRGALVALGLGDGTYGRALTGIANFGTTQGWTSNEGQLRLAGDVNGDGMADLVGFGFKGTFTALSNGDGTFQDAKLVMANFGRDQGWGSNDATPRAVADVNGDGIADIIGFGNTATFAALGNGDGTFGPVETLSEDFNRATAWRSQDAQPRQAADLDRDGDADLVGFSAKGVLTRLVESEGDTFVFETGDSVDRISDFDIFDTLDMTGTPLSAAQALAAAVQVGDDVEIAYAANDKVILENFLRADLTIDNFA